MMTIRILVTGSRHVDAAAEQLVPAALDEAYGPLYELGHDVVIVHGAARGVDTIAGFWAPPEVRIERHPAEWERLGRGAGHARNADMVRRGASVCLAFPRPDSAGTWNCIRLAANAGIPVRIYPLPVFGAGLP